MVQIYCGSRDVDQRDPVGGGQCDETEPHTIIRRTEVGHSDIGSRCTRNRSRGLDEAIIVGVHRQWHCGNAFVVHDQGDKGYSRTPCAKATSHAAPFQWAYSGKTNIT